MDNSIEQLIYEETDERLKKMADSSYVFPKKANKYDAWGIIILVGISLILLGLCMAGVIE